MNKFYVFSNIDFARKIFQKKFNEYDFIDLKIQGNPNIKKLKKRVYEVLNKPVIIESRKELNSSIYKMLNTENIILYFVFSNNKLIKFEPTNPAPPVTKTFVI